MRNSRKLLGICLTISAISVWIWFYVSYTTTARIVSAQVFTENKIYSEGGLTALPNPPAERRLDKIVLGRSLFSETKLSKTNAIACNSCHDLAFFGSDPKSFSVGINSSLGTANAPTVFNAVYNFRQFWDGRAKDLSDQVAGPIHNPKEMGTTWPDIAEKLKQDRRYREQFNEVYGRDPDENSIIDAIVSFESTLTTPNSAFDRYLKGDRLAMTAQQIEGFRKFQSFGCIACHQGRNVGGNMYQTLGVMGDYFKDRGGYYSSDEGRFAVTGDAADLHVFRVPSLRNVAMTAPYFHDGQVQRLDQAVKLMAKYQLGLTLSETDVADLLSFLNALTGDRPKSLSLNRGVANEATH